jgi:hypothetical protein
MYYVWTPERDQLLLNHYNGRAEVITRLARTLPCPRWTVKHRARVLGLARHKEPRWTAAEERVLQELLGAMPWRRLAKRLGRTVTAVKLHTKRMGLRKTTQSGLTANSAAKLLGCDIHRVTTWIRLGWLPAARRGTDRLPVQGGDCYLIRPEALRRFCIERPDQIDLRRVEKLWFIDLLADRAEQAGLVVPRQDRPTAATMARLDEALAEF